MKITWTIDFIIFNAILIRILFLFFCHLFDNLSLWSLKYTDIDYVVFTNSAKYIVDGSSPYENESYRYPPLLAYLLTWNITFHEDFGKVLFILCDSFICYLIYKIIYLHDDSSSGQKRALSFAFYWAINLFSIIICTRGSADSITNILVLAFIWFIQNNFQFISGLLLGFLIYWRLYPVIYLPSAFAYLLTKQSLYFRELASFCIAMLSMLCLCIGISYYFYKDSYLNNAILYHFTRVDVQHNFSIYFYPLRICESLRLDSNRQSINWSHVLSIISFSPHLFLNSKFIWDLVNHKTSLETCMFLQTFVFVIFNKVITAQYFTWYFIFIPLFANEVIVMKKVSLSYYSFRCFLLLCISWILALLLWLYIAYQLEFMLKSVVFELWISSIIFLLVHLLILVTLMEL